MNFVLQCIHAKFCHTFHWLLAFVWSLGFLAGLSVFKLSAPSFISLMHGFSFGSVSIVGLIISVTFPFLISALAVLYSKPLLVFTVCFLKAFFFTLVSISVILCYGSGGWVIHRLAMAHEVLSLPILYTFWYRSFYYRKIPSLSECFGWICIEFLILAMDYQLINPFLLSLEIL